ncbi:hypothetical protein JD969_00765 [Planctomycetota bacterium]|nr:hypothetical protein JD969_00765 [Planctomycetota bacterium]
MTKQTFIFLSLIAILFCLFATTLFHTFITHHLNPLHHDPIGALIANYTITTIFCLLLIAITFSTLFNFYKKPNQ